MKNTKKLLIILLSLAVIAASVSFAAVAAADGTQKMYLTLSASPSSGVGAGDVVTVTIKAVNNYNATTMCWPVLIPNAIFELVEAPAGGKIGNAKALNQLTAGGSSFSAVQSTEDRCFTSAYKKTQYTCLLLQWIGNTGSGGAVNIFNSTGGQNIMSFQIRVKQTPTVNSGKIVIPGAVRGVFTYQAITEPYYPESIFNIYSESVPASDFPYIDFGNPNVSHVEVAETTVYLQTEAPGIKAAAGKNDITFMTKDPYGNDLPYKLVYGFTGINFEPIVSETDVLKWVVPTGEATLRVTQSPGGYGTGAKIEVLKPSMGNQVVDTYYIVIFGDINGDSVVGGGDVTQADNALMYIPEWTMGIDVWTSPYFFACDVDGADFALNGADINMIDNAELGIGTVNQKHQGGFTYY